MATEVLRPNADVVADWTKSNLLLLTAWEHIDDAVLDPTNARTGGDGDHLTSSTAGQETEVGVGTFALGTNSVSAARGKVFAAGGSKRGIDLRLLTGATELVPATRVGPGSAEAWYTLSYTGALTQAQIDDLRLEMVCQSTAGGGGATAVTVYAAYVEVDHAAAGVAHTHTLADAVTGGDVLGKGLGVTRTEALGAGDDPGRAAAAARTFAEGAALADALSAAITLARGDALAGSDAASVDLSVAGVAHTQTISDAVAATDAVAKSAGVPFADAVALVDAAARRVGLSSADTLAAADAIAKTVTALRADAMAAVDAAEVATGGGTSWAQTLADGLVVGDSLTLTSAVRRQVADTAAATDAVSRAVRAVRTITDVLRVAEAVSPISSAAPPPPLPGARRVTGQVRAHGPKGRIRPGAAWGQVRR